MARLCSRGPHPLKSTPVRKCSSVQVERLDDFKVMTIGINRPDKRNSVNKETANLLYEAFDQFEQDDKLHCAILHGIGGNFCAGYDLTELAGLDKNNIANEIVSFGPNVPGAKCTMSIHKSF